MLREATPEFSILGEEYGSGDEQSDPSAPRWLVDPIDGTIGYARGLPLYSTLIALEEAGEPVLGLIDGEGCRPLLLKYAQAKQPPNHRHGHHELWITSISVFSFFTVT